MREREKERIKEISMRVNVQPQVHLFLLYSRHERDSVIKNYGNTAIKARQTSIEKLENRKFHNNQENDFKCLYHLL